MFLTYNEFREYDEYRKSTPPIEWLSEFDEYLSDYYGVQFMPTYYEKIDTLNPTRAIHNLHLIVFSMEEAKGIVTKNHNNPSTEAFNHEMQYISSIAKKYADNTGLPILKERDVFRVLRLEYYDENYRHHHLLSHKLPELKEELKKKFYGTVPFILSFGSNSHCIFNTKAEAKDFLSGDNYTEICGQIFKTLKQYDEYNVLTQDDIRIFADYKEHYEKIPMWGRWVSDLSKEEWDKYERSIIES